MNKNQMKDYFNKLRSNQRITGLEVLDEFCPRRQDSIWFSGEVVMNCVIDNRFSYFCRAKGEIRITHVPSGDCVVDKSGDSYRVREFLFNHGIKTDKQLLKAEVKGEFYFGNNNWYEDELIDNETGEWLTINADISDGPMCFDLEYLDQFIERVE